MKAIHKNSDLNEYITLLAPEELTDELIDLFEDFRLEDKRYRNEMSRHRAKISVEESQYLEVVIQQQATVEVFVIKNEDKRIMDEALETLTDKEKRRFEMHVKHGMTTREIASLEGATQRSIVKSISSAKNKLKIKLNKFSKMGTQNGI